MMAAILCGCGREPPKGAVQTPTVPMPEDQLLRAICPNGYSNGLYSLSPPWTGRVDTVYVRDTLGPPNEGAGAETYFDLIGVQTNRPAHGLDFGPVWIAQSSGSNEYTNVHLYKQTLPTDEDIQSCDTSDKLYALLGKSDGFTDGYGDNWAFFSMNADGRMNLLEISAFWMCGESAVRVLRFSRGFTTKSTGQVGPATRHVSSKDAADGTLSCRLWEQSVS